VKINFKGLEIDTFLRYDMLVDDLIIIENKAVEAFHPLYTAQALSYMTLLRIPKGILFNFNCTNIVKEGQKTLVNQYFEQLPDGD
jgi:GxxExxY protein